MAVLDLSLVTKSLANLLQHAIEASAAWDGAAPTITLLPLGERKGANVLGLYLYQVVENQQLKNRPAPDTSSGPIGYTPMALDLSYRLTAYHESENEAGACEAQTLLGLAMRAFHEYPVIDDSTRVVDPKGLPIVGTDGNPVQIFEDALVGGGNGLHINCQSVSQPEMVGHRTAGPSPLGISAYYLVSAEL